ncbi:hypothetical protein [Flavobacterium sp.]|uniref:hypothetical protein n=1 Tax=Flavobacterium sp. TaxID=239 RepID=UPI00391AD097
MASQLKTAEMQLLGFGHASKGFSIESLADAMGLKKSEWMKLRNLDDLKPNDKQSLDDKFQVKVCKCSRVIGIKNGICMTCNGVR